MVVRPPNPNLKEFSEEATDSGAASLLVLLATDPNPKLEAGPVDPNPKPKPAAVKSDPEPAPV